jgi:hypothetical protein
MTQDKFLRHHASEGDADNMRAVPAQRVHQQGGITGIVRHGEHRAIFAFVTLAQAALVIGEHLEMAGERTFEPGLRPPQIPAGAADQE